MDLFRRLKMFPTSIYPLPYTHNYNLWKTVFLLHASASHFFQPDIISLSNSHWPWRQKTTGLFLLQLLQTELESVGGLSVSKVLNTEVKLEWSFIINTLCYFYTGLLAKLQPLFDTNHVVEEVLWKNRLTNLVENLHIWFFVTSLRFV